MILEQRLDVVGHGRILRPVPPASPAFARRERQHVVEIRTEAMPALDVECLSCRPPIRTDFRKRVAGDDIRPRSVRSSERCR